jgi:hypothetical protein
MPGTAAPFNFNGLVRHYFLRAQPEMGDVMVTLAPKGDRSRSSHAIAVDLRERLRLALPAGGVIKVVETPPGPPVLATLLAEVYGPDEATRQKTALVLEQIFKSVPFHRRYRQFLRRPARRCGWCRTGQSSTTMAGEGRCSTASAR